MESMRIIILFEMNRSRSELRVCLKWVHLYVCRYARLPLTVWSPWRLSLCSSHFVQTYFPNRCLICCQTRITGATAINRNSRKRFNLLSPSWGSPSEFRSSSDDYFSRTCEILTLCNVAWYSRASLYQTQCCTKWYIAAFYVNVFFGVRGLPSDIWFGDVAEPGGPHYDHFGAPGIVCKHGSVWPCCVLTKLWDDSSVVDSCLRGQGHEV